MILFHGTGGVPGGGEIFSHDRNGKVAAAYEALTKEVTELEERAKNRSGPDRVR